LRVALANAGAGNLAADAVRIERLDAAGAPLRIVDLRGNPLNNDAHEFTLTELHNRIVGDLLPSIAEDVRFDPNVNAPVLEPIDPRGIPQGGRSEWT
jgi:hypothetical protein